MTSRENPAFNEEGETLLDEEIISSDEILDFINDEVEKRKDEFQAREKKREREREGGVDLDTTEKEAVEIIDIVFVAKKMKKPETLKVIHSIVNDRANKEKEKYMDDQKLAIEEVLRPVINDVFKIFEKKFVKDIKENREKNIPEALGENNTKEEKSEKDEELIQGNIPPSEIVENIKNVDDIFKRRPEGNPSLVGRYLDAMEYLHSMALLFQQYLNNLVKKLRKNGKNDIYIKSVLSGNKMENFKVPEIREVLPKIRKKTQDLNTKFFNEKDLGFSKNSFLDRESRINMTIKDIEKIMHEFEPVGLRVPAKNKKS